MKKLLAIAAIPLATATGWAQQLTPSMQVAELYGKEKPVQISDIRIDIKVVGSLAVTTVDLTFFNPNQRELEGELQFPLAEGQSVSRFALDINGKLREGVTVEKAKGQQVFESIIRRNVDPGLLEKTSGNNFRTRVYPLPAKGSRRVVVAYEQELIPDEDGYRFHLPVEYGGMIDRFDVNLSVYTAGPPPVINKSPWGNFSFNKAGNAYVAEYSARNYRAKNQLVFSIPAEEEIQLYVEKGKIDNRITFYSQLIPQVSQTRRKNIRRISLFKDASMSMEKYDRKLENALLDQYLGLLGNVTVDLYTFNLKTNKPRTFEIKNGEWSELRKALSETVYDGATHLGALDFSKVKADEILLFTDGLNNFGKVVPVTSQPPVNTIVSGLSADYSLLRYLSESTGGISINLTQQSPDEAVQALANERLQLISADYNKNEIEGLTTSGNTVDPRKGITIAGKLKVPKATITLNFGKANQISLRKMITIDERNAVDYENIVERLWAAKRISELDGLYETNKEEIAMLGQQYNIVTRNTSLIVLDNVEDYVTHHITPPEELLEEYNKLLNHKSEQDKKHKEDRMEAIVSLLKERKKWWDTKFKNEGSLSDSKTSSEKYEPRAAVVFEEEIMPLYEENAYADMSLPNSDDEAQIAPQRNKTATINLRGWEANAPYLDTLKKTKDGELYQTYLQLRKDYESTPSFYLDVSMLFEKRGLNEEALLILSNLAELKLEDYRLIRVLAHRLSQLKYYNYAIYLFRQVVELRPEEPQSFRDLGLALAQNGEKQEAIETLHKILEREWDARFPEIEMFAVEEINNIIAGNKKLNLSNIDKRIICPMPVDVRIVLNWDTDNSDMDLWVTDPNGERCFYANPLTKSGGIITRDFTDGYGPEAFLIKKAPKGKYTIQANYYGTREQTLIGPTTCYLEIYTYYGTKQETKKTIMLRLSENKEVIDIGEIEF